MIFFNEEKTNKLVSDRDFDFAPNQSEDLLERIMEVHKTLKVQGVQKKRLNFSDINHIAFHIS